MANMKLVISKIRFNWRYFLLTVLLVLAIYVLVPQISAFRSGWHLLQHPDPVWTVIAVSLTLLTYLAATATYCLLAFKPLKYGWTLLIQFAATFINRLLPGGIGSLGANYAYLRHRRHSATQAGSVVAINNLLGMLGHGLWLAIILLISSAPIAPDYSDLTGNFIKILAVAMFIVVGWSLFFGWPRLKQQALGIYRQLLRYQQEFWRLPAALMSSMALTLCNVVALLTCGLALGVHLPFIVIFIIFTLGIGAGTATPTPGGLGGFEAALAAGFIAYGVGSPAALATALLYRLISYWLPLGLGAPSFFICERRGLFKFGT